MKKRFLTILMALNMILVLLPVNVFATVSTSGTIQGTVVDAETQKPVSATVTLYAKGNSVSPLASATADASTGTYMIAPKGGITAGQYTLVFTSSLYLSRSLDIEVTSNDGLLIAAATGLYPVGRCDGKVTDSKSGAALSGVTVNVYTTGGSLNISTTTGTDGKYSIETQAGIYNVEFVKSGYTTARLECISLGTIGTTHNTQMIASSGGNGGNGNSEGDKNDDKKIIASGTCGDGLTWTLDANGILTISGTGAMGNYSDFGGCPWYDYISQIRFVIIKDGVTSIGDSAFSGCSNLVNITIPDSIISIGDRAFSSCSSLTSIIIPRNVTNIGTYAFVSCKALTAITVPNSVTSIGDAAFRDCNGLTSVAIGDGVTNIGDNAFGGCGKITSLTIGTAVTRIGPNAFNGCSSLTSVTIPNSVTQIGLGAFANCDGLTSLSIGNGLTTIRYDYGFACPNLASVFISHGVTSIDDYVFGTSKAVVKGECENCSCQITPPPSHKTL